MACKGALKAGDRVTSTATPWMGVHQSPSAPSMAKVLHMPNNLLFGVCLREESQEREVDPPAMLWAAQGILPQQRRWHMGRLQVRQQRSCFAYEERINKANWTAQESFHFWKEQREGRCHFEQLSNSFYLCYFKILSSLSTIPISSLETLWQRLDMSPVCRLCRCKWSFELWVLICSQILTCVGLPITWTISALRKG